MHLRGASDNRWHWSELGLRTVTRVQDSVRCLRL